MTAPQVKDQPTSVPPRNGVSITVLVLALVGVVLSLVPFTGFIISA